MNKLYKLFLISILFFVLVACAQPLDEDSNKEPDEIVLTGVDTAFMEEEYELVLPAEFANLDTKDLVVTSENDLVAFVQSDNTLYIFDAGTTVITAKNKHYTYRLTLEVLKRSVVNEEIDSIIRLIRNQTTLEGKDSLEVVTSLPDYVFKISYVSDNPEIVDVDGSFTRGLADQYVNLQATLIYKGVVRVFPVPVKVPMIPASEQKDVIEAYLQEQVDSLIRVGSGQLPTTIKVYGLNVKWRSSNPGVIDSKNGFHLTYNKTANILTAEYKIGFKEHEMKIKYDSSGVTEQEKETYIRRVLEDLIPEQAGRGLSLIYGTRVDVIQDIVYPNTETQLRPGTGTTGVKMPGGPQYIVIHDTGMSGSDDDADGLSRYIHSQADFEGGRVASWHFSIDDKKVYQHVPTDEIAWHAGDGSSVFNPNYDTANLTAIGGGNRNGIGIETCINPGNDYGLTLKRTAKLTAQLLHQYGLTLDRIKQHYNFNAKNCPQVIRNSGWMWDVFLKDVEIEYFLMMVADDVQVNWTVSHPKLVLGSGLIVEPILDTIVQLKLNLTLDGSSYELNYSTTVKGMTFSQKVTQIYMRLLYENMVSSTTQDIVLPSGYEEYVAKITWKSSHPDILDGNGKYTKPEVETQVRLTAVIEINGETTERAFVVTVK